MKNVLQGKLNWVTILATKKNVNLTITDSTSATEFGVNSDSDPNIPDSHLRGAEDEEEGSSLQGVLIKNVRNTYIVFAIN